MIDNVAGALQQQACLTAEENSLLPITQPADKQSD